MTPILRRAIATLGLHPRDHSPHGPRPFVVPARSCIRMARFFVGPARRCVASGRSCVRIARPLLAMTPTFGPIRRDHASHGRDGAVDEGHSPLRRRDMRMHSPVPPSHGPAVRSKGTGHARQGCPSTGLSPGRFGGLTWAMRGMGASHGRTRVLDRRMVRPLRVNLRRFVEKVRVIRRIPPGHPREGRAVAPEPPDPTAKGGSLPSQGSRCCRASH